MPSRVKPVWPHGEPHLSPWRQLQVCTSWAGHAHRQQHTAPATQYQQSPKDQLKPCSSCFACWPQRAHNTAVCSSVAPCIHIIKVRTPIKPSSSAEPFPNPHLSLLRCPVADTREQSSLWELQLPLSLFSLGPTNPGSSAAPHAPWSYACFLCTSLGFKLIGLGQHIWARAGWDTPLLFPSTNTTAPGKTTHLTLTAAKLTQTHYAVHLEIPYQWTSNTGAELHGCTASPEGQKLEQDGGMSRGLCNSALLAVSLSVTLSVTTTNLRYINTWVLKSNW